MKKRKAITPKGWKTSYDESLLKGLDDLLLPLVPEMLTLPDYHGVAIDFLEEFKSKYYENEAAKGYKKPRKQSYKQTLKQTVKSINDELNA